MLIGNSTTNYIRYFTKKQRADIYEKLWGSPMLYDCLTSICWFVSYSIQCKMSILQVTYLDPVSIKTSNTLPCLDGWNWSWMCGQSLDSVSLYSTIGSEFDMEMYDLQFSGFVSKPMFWHTSVMWQVCFELCDRFLHSSSLAISLSCKSWNSSGFNPIKLTIIFL